VDSGILYWLAVYLVSGLVFFVVARVVVKLFYKNGLNEDQRSLLRALEKSRPRKDRLRQQVFNIGAGIVAWLIWPIAIGILIREFHSDGKEQLPTPFDNEPVFNCSMKDLQKVVDIVEVEKQATYSDPISAVPNIPFGHLNPAWERFKGGLEPGDAVWRFVTTGIPSNPKNQRHQYSEARRVVRGYSAVRDKKVVAEFLSEWG
jgi:hypothetical protein